jgi:hypothetical protein
MSPLQPAQFGALISSHEDKIIRFYVVRQVTRVEENIKVNNNKNTLFKTGNLGPSFQWQSNLPFRLLIATSLHMGGFSSSKFEVLCKLPTWPNL